MNLGKIANWTTRLAEGVKEIGDFFGLHYSRVSRIIREAKRKS
jgi:hypothetical protein